MIHARLATVVLAFVCMPVLAQTPQYTYEMRLIADGQNGAPSGPWPQYPTGLSTSIQHGGLIGFWLQARVSQIGGQNLGIVRLSSPPVPGLSTITLTDSTFNGSVLRRGAINAAGTIFGRGQGYRSGGPATGANGNSSSSQPFPSTVGNENGAIDGGTDGLGADRIYAFDCYTWQTVNGIGEEGLDNPFSTNASTVPGIVPDGVFSPWANLYRFVVDITTFGGGPRTLTLQATAQVVGSSTVQEVQPAGSGLWRLAAGTPATLSTTWSISIPSPASITCMALVSGLILRRRPRTSR